MATRRAQVKPLGRPRAFSEEKALEAAMRVFWQKGYEGATLTDLTSAMQINRSSLYWIFGDKEKLFYRALDRYRSGPVSFVIDSTSEKTARKTIETLLRKTVQLLSDPNNPPGCLSVQAALAVGSEAEAIRQATIAFRKVSEVALTERFFRAQSEGELSSGTDPGDLARFTLTILTGLGVQGAGGASKQELSAIVDLTLKTLPF